MEVENRMEEENRMALLARAALRGVSHTNRVKAPAVRAQRYVVGTANAVWFGHRKIAIKKENRGKSKAISSLLQCVGTVLPKTTPSHQTQASSKAKGRAASLPRATAPRIQQPRQLLSGEQAGVPAGRQHWLGIPPPLPKRFGGCSFLLPKPLSPSPSSSLSVSPPPVVFTSLTQTSCESAPAGMNDVAGRRRRRAQSG